MKCFKLIFLVAILAGLGFVLACDDGGSSNADTGSLSVYMSDAAADQFQAVYVSIAEVRVHLGEEEASSDDNGQASAEAENEGGWTVVATPDATYNLLELVNGVMAELGTTELESGHYTQMRLLLAETPDDGLNLQGQAHPYPHYVIDNDGNVEELKVPSGYQSGIKLVHGFDIEAGLTAELVLDFDAARSVVVTGNGKYLLKPTIKVLDTVNNAIVKGVVTDDAGNVLAGALVSVQVYDAAAADEAAQVGVFTSTRTDENGVYQMFLPPGEYLIVAYKPFAATDSVPFGMAYGPECAAVSAEYDAAYERNFELAGNITGSVAFDLTLPSAEGLDAVIEPVTLSIRQPAACGEDARIEIASLVVSGSGTYTIDLPAGIDAPGTYIVVASYNSMTLVDTVDVVAESGDATVSFDFMPVP